MENLFGRVFSKTQMHMFGGKTDIGIGIPHFRVRIEIGVVVRKREGIILGT